MAVRDAHVFPGFLTPVLTQLSFQSHQLLLSHTFSILLVEVRGENLLERKFTSIGSLTHNHQVMSLTPSPLCHPGGAYDKGLTELLWLCHRITNLPAVQMVQLALEVLCFAFR